jgi:hypothetical protein
MKAYHIPLAAAAAGLLLAAGSPASATPLVPTSPAPVGLERFDGAIEPVHYRRHRAVRRHYRPHYWGGPAIRFGFAPAPYYSYPYRHTYRPYYPPSYPYGYSYGYAPAFSFGFHLR